MLSEGPTALVHRSLTEEGSAKGRHPSKETVKVRLLKDATGYSSHLGTPALISCRKGDERPISGDLALLWFASETAEAVSAPKEPEPEPPADPEGKAASIASSTAMRAAMERQEEERLKVKAAVESSKAKRGKGSRRKA